MNYFLTLTKITILSGVLLNLGVVQATGDIPFNAAPTIDDSSFFTNSVFTQGKVSLPPLYSLPQTHAAETQQLMPGMLTLRQGGAGNSGSFFQRGTSLNQGAGVLTKIDNIPLSINSHVSGHGYTDLNILISELIASYTVTTGPYDMSAGSGAYAGSINYSMVNNFKESILQMSLGQDAYFRMLAATSDKQKNGDFLYAADVESYDGAWKNIKEDEESLVSYIKNTWKQGAVDYGVSVIAYRNNWNVPTQIPSRAVNRGTIGELDVVDSGDHGKSRLVGISLKRNRNGKTFSIKTSFFISGYEYIFLSNTTYFLKDETNGDQIEQVDKRVSWGAEHVYKFDGLLLNSPASYVLGLQVQNDLIGESATYHTSSSGRLGTIQSDRINQRNAGFYISNSTHLADKLSASLSLRYDIFNFDVSSTNTSNSGDVTDGASAGSAALDYSFNKNTRIYLKYSHNYALAHARDITNSTVTQSPFSKVEGGEAGVRIASARLAASMSLWYLESEKEYVYSAENNTTEAKRSSKRIGIDLNARYRLTDYAVTSLGASFSDSKYKARDESVVDAGDNIPGTPDAILKASISYMKPGDYFGSLHLKYLGKRPLNESGSIESNTIAVVNMRAGYRKAGFGFHFDILNLLDSDSREIEYLYKSRLADEAEGVRGTHYRIIEPRSYRLYVTHEF